MKEKNRKSIESCLKLPQFTTMNVIDGQAGLVLYSSFIFDSLTINNILNIIVLIILAGVAINLTLGDNGILRRAEQSKESYNLAKEKEALEIEIMRVQVEIFDTEGRKATLNDLQNKIDTSKYTIELHFEPVATTENVNTVPTYAIVNRINTMYYFTVDSDLVITDVELAEPARKYIKFSEITWENGKASITLSTTEEGTIEYKIGEDGIYQGGTTVSNLNHADVVYARINNNGEYTEEETKIICDIINPEEFTISVSEDTITYESLKITSQGTEDKQTGLKDYSFVVTKDGSIVQEIKNQTVTEYMVKDLTEKTQYVVYMLAYDNAGNVRKSNEVTVTTKNMPSSKLFGQYINYSVDLNNDENITNDWKILYIEDDPTSPNYESIYIIASNYLLNEKIPSGAGTQQIAASILKTCPYALSWNADSSNPTYKTIGDATNGKFNVREKFMFSWNKNTTKWNIRCVSRLLDTDTWSGFANGTSGTTNIEGSYAIGSPTAELWVKSWNTLYPTEKLSLNANHNYGYQAKAYVEPNSYYGYRVNIYSSYGYQGYNNTLFFPYKTNTSNCVGYILSSPSCSNDTSVISIQYDGMWNAEAVNSSTGLFSFSLRPVVYIPNAYEVKLNSETNMYEIVEKIKQ